MYNPLKLKYSIKVFNNLYINPTKKFCLAQPLLLGTKPSECFLRLAITSSILFGQEQLVRKELGQLALEIKKNKK